MKNTFPSRYSNGKTVSAAQYVTELICENKAKTSKQDLHYRFWENKEWSAYYRNQIATANTLLKKFEPRAIIDALKDPRAARIYSLRAPHLKPIIEEKQVLLDKQNKEFTLEVDDSKTEKTYRKEPPKKEGIFSKLRNLDDE
jgi:hypothetical protein